LRVAPGFPAGLVAEGVLAGLDALVLEVFLSGTAPTQDPDFLRLLREAKRLGVPVVLVSGGAAAAPGDSPSRVLYAAARPLLEAGCHLATGMTFEAAYVKACLIAGNCQGLSPRGRARIWSGWNKYL
jgi:L-asparaginase/Glu-tRNA(Gln) amidotransferase subunit D